MVAVTLRYELEGYGYDSVEVALREAVDVRVAAAVATVDLEGHLDLEGMDKEEEAMRANRGVDSGQVAMVGFVEEGMGEGEALGEEGAVGMVKVGMEDLDGVAASVVLEEAKEEGVSAKCTAHL